MSEQIPQAALDDDTVAELLKSINIPPCPTVVSMLMAELRREDADLKHMARLLGGDVGLAAAVLKVVNSPFFGLRNKVSSVQQALSMLGLKHVSSIVTGLALKQALSPPGVSMERFWERSSLHAAICARLAVRLPGVGREDAYTFGLFHDCGIPVLMQRFPEYKETLALANRTMRPMVDVEYDRHATSHVVVGAMLARNWQLPTLISDAIKLHHDPEVACGTLNDVPESVRALVCVSVVAEKLAADFLGYQNEPEWEVLRPAACEYLSLDDDDIEDLRAEISDDLVDLSALRK